MEEPDIERWSVPFYLDFLHGNFLRTQDLYCVASPRPRSWEQWRDLLCRELREVTPQIAGDLMTDANWRAQICGAFFCGLKRWDEFTLDIGRRLVAKRNGFSTQGYAFALARMPSHAGANYLCGYLSRVGRPEDTTGWYGADVEWVLASLQWVDEKMNTHRVEPYIEKLVPFWQKQRFQNLEKWYREVPSMGLRQRDWEDETERELIRVEKELSSYFLPDDGVRQSEWFWKLMATCELHFDAPAK